MTPPGRHWNCMTSSALSILLMFNPSTSRACEWMSVFGKEPSRFLFSKRRRCSANRAASSRCLTDSCLANSVSVGSFSTASGASWPFAAAGHGLSASSSLSRSASCRMSVGCLSACGVYT
eukprot:CAMPEP_0170621138 /NCGR_PEP_ID=MMETSP0224-20130122/28443_1 /TAXON_ID=285029 /ORGANISM="Togula jolla, Strain CCCM 725" /LENGTH=119 /DNA_ID=CAMNT_0010947381 /DNA_START=211 /DNA_END=570 /DNA_ORIENTATION=+